jgi:hypothetical protein
LKNTGRLLLSFAIVATDSSSTGAAATQFACPGANTQNATEANRQAVMPLAYTFSQLHVQTGAAQPATGTHTITLRKNGVDTALQVVVPAGAAAGLFSNTSQVATYAAGDLLSLELVNSSATESAGVLIGWGVS